MKFLITAIAMMRDTRRRAGKAWTEVIDTDVHEPYRGKETPHAVETAYENQLPDTSKIVVKVVDVREARDRTDQQWPATVS